MKKEMIVLLLLGIIFISPFVLAQEQVQTYEGFDRFVDNVRMFFSFGDAKVMLALEIKEKEVNSALVNTENENQKKASENLENAWKKLQVIQEKVSLNVAEEVKASSSQIREQITQEENLPTDFEVYSLEEEKTELTAEWVIEVNGQEGQNLTNEIVVNGTMGQTRVVEIENKIDQIDNEISEWVVEHTYAEGTTADGEAGVVVEGGLVRVVKTEVAQGDNGLKAEVRTSVAKNRIETNEDDEGGYAPGTVAGGDSPGDSIDETYDDNSVNNGDCGEGVVCGGEDDVIEGGEGIEGTNDIAPAVESNEGDEGSSEGESTSTGEAIKNIKSEDNFLTNFFKNLFG